MRRRIKGSSVVEDRTKTRLESVRNTPSTSLPVMGEIAGVNTASLGGYLHSTRTRARWAEGFHDELNGHMFDLERDGLLQVVLCPWLTM